MLNTKSTHVFSCYTPNKTSNENSPYFEKYLKKFQRSHKKKEILIMPLCNGKHFEGYIINVPKKMIIHVDSLKCNARNSVSLMISEIVYPEQAGVSFSSLFKNRKQFDSCSCGVWLIAGILSYVEQIEDVPNKDFAFKLCHDLLKRKSIRSVSRVLTFTYSPSHTRCHPSC